MSAVTHTYRFSGKGEDFGPRASGMVTLHTWESSPDKNHIVDAIAGAKWQDRDDTLGSYNRVICVDGVLSCVPDDHASGGVNPGSSSWSPRPWLYDYLDADEIANPNFFTLNLCAMGQKAYYDKYGWPDAIIDGFARSIIDEERRIGGPVVVTNHADFQTNRFDAGPIATDLVMKRYKQLTATLPDTAVEVDMTNEYLKKMEPVVNRRATMKVGATARRLPIFDPKDYNAHKVHTHQGVATALAVGWVEGTNLTLSDGSVFDARTRWLATTSSANGIVFYHERDVAALNPIEVGDCTTERDTIEQQTERIAELQTAIGQRDSAITKKNVALDKAIALNPELVSARKA